MKGFVWYLVAAVVFAFTVTAIKSKKVSKTRSEIKTSPKLTAIYDYIFANGKPSRIAITQSNEIFFGPIGTEFKQVPGNMIPNMGSNDRLALGYELTNRSGYSYRLCNGAGHQNGMGDTGNDYIDRNVEFLLLGNIANDQGW